MRLSDGDYTASDAERDGHGWPTADEEEARAAEAEVAAPTHSPNRARAAGTAGRTTQRSSTSYEY